MSFEAYKPIWALQEANETIFISFDSPDIIEDRILAERSEKNSTPDPGELNKSEENSLDMADGEG
jgi:hypothetical protein